MAEYLFRFIFLKGVMVQRRPIICLKAYLSFLGFSSPLWFLKLDVFLGKLENEQAFRSWRLSCPWSYRQSILPNKNIFLQVLLFQDLYKKEGYVLFRKNAWVLSQDGLVLNPRYIIQKLEQTTQLQTSASSSLKCR